MSHNTVAREERLARVRNLPGSRDLKTDSSSFVHLGEEGKTAIGLARGSGFVIEKDRVKIQTGAAVWDDPNAAASRESTVESEASLPRWRTPVSWVRDQRMRGWGRLSG